jgi:Ternary complex associated domain 9
VAIREFVEGKRRGRICFWPELPQAEDQEAFTRRGYAAEAFTPAMRTPRELNQLDSLVISQSSTDLKSIHPVLRAHARTLLEFDCRIYVRVAAAPMLQGRGRAVVVSAIRQLKLPGGRLTREEQLTLGPEQQEGEGVVLPPYVFVCDAGWTWERLAQLIADNPAGSGPNLDVIPDAVSAAGSKVALGRESVTLLRRAFSDCSEVHLQQMQYGLSGVRTFRGYATQISGLEGKWPATYFIKIGARKKISAEYNNYQGHALQYIPFNLAPRLTLERCGLGASEGIIVGDFVEQTEALRDCASASRAVHAIGTLFNRTLAAWRHAARVDDRSLPEALSGPLLDEAAIPNFRKATIRSLGATADLAYICQLLDQCRAKPILVGTIHGDLNATNILVRFSDAILIDFERLQEGQPLLYDAASVEAGLLVDGFAQDCRPISEWLESLEPLYGSHEMFDWRVPCHPKDQSAWFFDCVREIRAHARQLELRKGQYATALALALVKKGCNPHAFHDRRDELRSAGYALGDRILNLVAGEYAKNPP